MPYINVQITKEGVTTAQKQRIVREMTQTLVDVLGKNPERIHILIDEIEPDNWAFDGKLVSEHRQKSK